MSSQHDDGGAGGDAATTESAAGTPTDDAAHGGAAPQDGDPDTSSAGAHAVMGDAGAPPVVVEEPEDPNTGLGARCTDNGALSCKGPAQKLSLLCKDGYWTENTVCKADENCDQTSGVCAPILAECKDKAGSEHYCAASGDKIFECGADLTSTKEVETCTGKCVPAATSASCAPDTCGDGKVQSPEECDDDNQDQTDGCTNACKKATCGDGSVWKGHEACDDGNAKNDDACTATCVAATCGDGFVWTGKETCDDKNKVNTDACSNTCQKAACGDGILQSGEECDDKNAVSGDGCSKTCTVEPVKLVGMSSGTKTALLCALGANGQIRCFAPGGSDWSYTTVALGAGEKATDIAAGESHVCAVLNDGKVKCWGDNRIGQLGLGDKVARPLTAASPVVDLGAGRLAIGITASGLHSCALLKDGTALCWGSNETGQLGFPRGNTFNPIGDEPGEMGLSLRSASQVDGRKYVQLIATYYSVYAVREDRTAFAWGADSVTLNQRSNVNLGSTATVTQLSANSDHACAILTDGNTKCWGGANDWGQLATGDDVPLYYSEDLGDALSPVQLGAGKTAKSITAFGGSTCVVLNDGSLKCWGANFDGQLGLGHVQNVGGVVGDMAKLKPLDLGTGRKAKQVGATLSTVCALLEEASIVCWGAVPGGLILGDEPNEMGDKLPIVKLKF